jgi:hypothetical protein
MLVLSRPDAVHGMQAGYLSRQGGLMLVLSRLRARYGMGLLGQYRRAWHDISHTGHGMA